MAFRNCNKAVKTSEEHVYTSALATTEFVQTQKPNGTAFVIGEGGLLNARTV